MGPARARCDYPVLDGEVGQFSLGAVHIGGDKIVPSDMGFITSECHEPIL